MATQPNKNINHCSVFLTKLFFREALKEVEVFVHHEVCLIVSRFGLDLKVVFENEFLN
jgi:hypothetical protein